MELSQAKIVLIKQAEKRFPGKTIEPCGKCNCLLESFTVIEVKEKKELVLWFNVGKGTFAEKMKIC